MNYKILQKYQKNSVYKYLLALLERHVETNQDFTMLKFPPRLLLGIHNKRKTNVAEFCKFMLEKINPDSNVTWGDEC